MTRERVRQLKQQAAQVVEELGGERCAPLVVFQFVQMGEKAAQALTAEQIAQEVAKQEEEERKAEAADLVCMMSADFVRWLLESVQKFAKAPAPVRSYLIRHYL